MIELVEEIASEARIWAEKYADNDTRVFTKNLDCMCAIASSYLSQQLHRHKIPHLIGLYDSEDFGHCFILHRNCEDEFIIDITATQFNSSQFKKVEIVNTKDINYNSYEFWTTTHRFVHCKDLLEYQRDHLWYSEHRIDRTEKLMHQILSYHKQKQPSIKSKL